MMPENQKPTRCLDDVLWCNRNVLPSRHVLDTVSTGEDAATPQPPPKSGKVEIVPLVIADMSVILDSNAIISALKARSATGLAKYGTPLQSHNGRDALMDAYQEFLDGLCYLRQAIEEESPLMSDALADCYTDSINLAYHISKLVEAKKGTRSHDDTRETRPRPETPRGDQGQD